MCLELKCLFVCPESNVNYVSFFDEGGDEINSSSSGNINIISIYHQYRQHSGPIPLHSRALSSARVRCIKNRSHQFLNSGPHND